MNQIQHEQYTEKGGIYQQLTLPISENILIDEHEPVYVANAQLEELDYGKLYQAYSPRGRKSAAEPRIMFKLLVYGYVSTDAKGRESIEHGTALFPAACYHDDLQKMEGAWHWHEELEVFVAEKDTARVPGERMRPVAAKRLPHDSV